jgi:hypothetical protein
MSSNITSITQATDNAGYQQRASMTPSTNSLLYQNVSVAGSGDELTATIGPTHGYAWLFNLPTSVNDQSATAATSSGTAVGSTITVTLPDVTGFSIIPGEIGNLVTVSGNGLYNGGVWDWSSLALTNQRYSITSISANTISFLSASTIVGTSVTINPPTVTFVVYTLPFQKLTVSVPLTQLPISNPGGGTAFANYKLQTQLAGVTLPDIKSQPGTISTRIDSDTTGGNQTFTFLRDNPDHDSHTVSEAVLLVKVFQESFATSVV